MKHQAPVTVQLMGDDQQDVVSYRRKLAALTGSVSAAILLSRILKWAKHKNYEPFYKFREPCKHDKYTDGDSWVEDIEFTAAEFDHALKVIGTKLKKGTKRTDVEAVDYPVRTQGESDADYLKRFQFALQHLVIYWTDNSRVTWYELNSALLDKFTNSIYLDSHSSVKYLRSRVYGVILKDRKLNSSRKVEEVEIHSSDQTPDQTQKEEKIDHARDSSFSNDQPDPIPAELQTLPDDDPIADAQRLTDARDWMDRLIADGYDPNAPIAPLPPVETIGIPYHIANGFGLTGFADPYWEAFQSAGKIYTFVDKRVPANAHEIAEFFKAENAIPEEVEIAIREHLRVREADTRYTFEFALRDWRKWKASRTTPTERDPALVSAVFAGWKYAPSSDASNRLTDFLAGAVVGKLARQDWGQFQFTDQPLTPAELYKFIGWYKAQSPQRATPPETAKTLRERIDAFRAQQRPAPTAPTTDTYRPAERYTPTPEELAERRRLSEEARKRAERTVAL